MALSWRRSDSFSSIREGRCAARTASITSGTAGVSNLRGLKPAYHAFVPDPIFIRAPGGEVVINSAISQDTSSSG